MGCAQGKTAVEQRTSAPAPSPQLVPVVVPGAGGDDVSQKVETTAAAPHQGSGDAGQKVETTAAAPHQGSGDAGEDAASIFAAWTANGKHIMLS